MASSEEINAAARAVAAGAIQAVPVLRVRIGELIPPKERGMPNTRNRYPGAGQKIYELLVAHPDGMFASDLAGLVRAEHPGMNKQVVYNMLSALQRRGHVVNLGKGTGRWGPGKTAFGKKRRTYTKRTPEPRLEKQREPMAEISAVDADMIIQNARVAMVDLDKLLTYVQQETAKQNAVRKLLGG